MYSASVPQLLKMLSNMERWIDKAEAHAQAKGYDADTLLQARLAPDMFPLVRQFQSAADTAKFIGARLSNQPAPRHPDTETTFTELRSRLQQTRAFLAEIREADFVGAKNALVHLSYLPQDKRLTGPSYLNESALPNFYFHASMAYALLRHNGVDVGKHDYMGELPLVDAP